MYAIWVAFTIERDIQVELEIIKNGSKKKKQLIKFWFSQSPGAVEYTDSTSAERLDTPQWVHVI